MRISAKGEYAIRAILDLAMRHGKGLVPIQEIAARQGIPQRYLEQVLLLLKRAGFLVSKRGSAGGYDLERPPSEITVGEVLRAVEGNLTPLEVVGRGRRGRRRNEASEELADLWQEISDAVAAVIDRTSFADLSKRAEARRAAARPMYHI